MPPSAHEVETVPEGAAAGRRPKRRIATVFDAVAGRVGVNGFLTEEQLTSSRCMPLAPEEVLVRSINAPSHISDHFYSAESRLSSGDLLPESDLLKSIHQYTADFYARATSDRGKYDFKSLDETALIALGILIEEAAGEVLGETGDMALVEPSREADGGAPESKITQHQVKGKVYARPSPDYGSQDSGGSQQADDEGGEEGEEGEGESARKRRR